MKGNRCEDLDWDQAIKYQKCRSIISQYAQSALDDVQEIVHDTIASVNAREPRLYHETHILFEENNMKGLNLDQRKLLAHHQMGHRIALDLRDTTKFHGKNVMCLYRFCTIFLTLSVSITTMFLLFFDHFLY